MYVKTQMYLKLSYIFKSDFIDILFNKSKMLYFSNSFGQGRNFRKSLVNQIYTNKSLEHE